MRAIQMTDTYTSHRDEESGTVICSMCMCYEEAEIERYRVIEEDWDGNLISESDVIEEYPEDWSEDNGRWYCPSCQNLEDGIGPCPSCKDAEYDEEDSDGFCTECAQKRDSSKSEKKKSQPKSGYGEIRDIPRWGKGY